MLKNIDMEAAMRRLAERKIEAAIEEGKFANLEGAGKPLDLEPPPADENARMLWWALKLFRQNDVIPDEVRYRKTVESIRVTLATATSEEQVVARVGAMNELIRKINTMGTNAIRSTLTIVDVDAAVAQWRTRQANRVAESR